MATSAGVCPWVPEKPFFEENGVAVDAIFDQIAHDFPGSGVEQARTAPGSLPTSEAMSWMWTRLMGRQHGSTEGFEGKIPLTLNRETPYWGHLQSVHYGPYGFTDPNLASGEDSYTNSLILGGFPQEMVARLGAAVTDPQAGNVAAATLLTGQRLRWQSAVGERSVSDIYKAVGHYSGVDMDQLRQRSPWVRAEERKVHKEGNVWSGPYATEFELGRLSAEAFFYDVIDWKNYDVQVTQDPSPSEQSYRFRNETRVVPPRVEALITYELLNGTKAHILNARAVGRAMGVPRPTSDSQAREMVDLGMIGSDERIATAVTLPHIRAGIDITIRLLDLVPGSIATTEIVAPPLLPDKEALTGLGEIPATHKADLRLRALLAGGNPDASELVSL